MIKYFNKRNIIISAFHLAFWIGLVLLINSQEVNLKWGPFERSKGSILIPLLYGLGFGAIIFYSHTNWLIPKYFKSLKNVRFWFKSIAILFLASFAEALLDMVYIVFENYELAKQQFEQYPLYKFLEWSLYIFILAIIPNTGLWILAFAYRLPQDWVKSEGQKNQLLRDKMQSELNFLRAQINPHFLFNGINSVYHMIGSNDTKARQTLLQFSDLLRYQLYECNENYISLEKEIDYLKNYIGIEKVRKEEDAVIRFEDHGIQNSTKLKELKIAPLLLSPIIENAFKYVSNHSISSMNFINVDIKLDKEENLILTSKNSFNENELSFSKKEGGIGLSNVKRRLSLLYPEGKYRLEINKNSNIYSVELKIDLHED